MTHFPSGTFSAVTESIRRYDPDGSKLRAINRRLEDPNNPNRPEVNINPCQVEPDDVLVLERDDGTRYTKRVLGVTKGWDHQLHLRLGCAQSPLPVVTSHLTIKPDGLTSEHGVFSGREENARIANIIRGREH